jgi:hypothetical protein
MKMLKLIIAIFTIVILFASCKKCKTVCLNGGAVTEDCGCKCPGGYSGLNCEKYNPCYNVTCLNGGTCANGLCNCPPGYTGSNCGTALPLKSVTITRITVNQYPTSKSVGAGGVNWDAGTTSSRYPDIYININPGTSAIPVQSSAIYYDVNSAPQTYTIASFTLNNPSNDYSISLWDDDFPSADEFMGGIYFKPSDYKGGYPPTIQVSSSAARIDYTVYVTWNF